MLIHQSHYLPSTTEHTAYCDSSGQEESPVIVVAGFASSEAKWLEFGERWDALMREYHVPSRFHTVAYVAAYQPEYRQFRDNIPLRVKFESEAIRILKETTRKAISFAVKPKVQLGINEEYEVSESFKTPLAICGLRVVLEGMEWMKRHSRGHNRVEAVKFVFEDGDQKQREFSDALLRVTGERPLFESKEKSGRFVAADILAWRHARLIRLGMGLDHDKHECFADVFTRIPHDGCQMLDTDNLRSAYERIGFARKVQQ